LEERRGFSITDFYMILVMTLWGSDYPFAKFAMREVSPMSFAAMRTLMATVILFPFFLRQEKDWSLSKKHFLGVIGLACLGTFLNRVCWSVGLNLTTASNAGLLMATSPIFVLIVSFFFLRTDLTFRAAVGILVSFVGVFLVIKGDWKGWGFHTFQGDLIILGAALSWAFFTVLAKKMLKDHSSLKVTAYIMLTGTVLFLPFLPNEKAGGWREISWMAWFSVIYVAVMGNSLAYFLWIRGIQNIGPLRAILYQYLMPVTAILFAIPFLGETIRATQVWGAAVVFGGIFLARSK
jgi:drug/metabolite transporter (DMT)-like permease